jgi:hypothetical protein
VASDLVFGVDLDNTLIIYDDLWALLAAERGLLPPGDAIGKRQIRDRIRQLPDGEIHWQKLQAAVYGPRIGDARLADGFLEFLASAHEAGARVFAVSHKTEFAGYDETGTNLRHAVLDWMADQGLVGNAKSARHLDGVCFGTTRQEKIEFIRSLGCTHFIDDLEETFLEPSFPPGVAKILYAPNLPPTVPSGVTAATSWMQIHDQFFKPRR